MTATLAELPVILTIPQAAEVLGIHWQTLYRIIRENNGEWAPGRRVVRLSPGRIGIYRAQLERYLEESSRAEVAG